METKNLAAAHGVPTMEWDAVCARLRAGFDQGPGSQEGEPGRHSTWVTTINADGGPHMNAVGAIWLDDHFYLVTGPGTRRGRNLVRDPRCALALSVREFDLVVEGRAERVLGEELERVAARYRDDGWPAEVVAPGEGLDASFMAQSAGPAPWHVHRIDATSAHAVEAVEPGRATRWTF
jgi:hypothetical protein